jgi:hypothetical protein
MRGKLKVEGSERTPGCERPQRVPSLVAFRGSAVHRLTEAHADVRAAPENGAAGRVSWDRGIVLEGNAHR